MMSDNRTDIYWDYMEDVLSGKQLTGKYVKLRVQRDFDEIRRSMEDDSYEWEFRSEEAERYIDFIQRYCVHTSGALGGQPFILSPWQQMFFAMTFGWFRRDTNSRRYNRAYLFVGRKSGKTQMAAAAALAMMVLDGEAEGEYVFAANKKDQADIGFKRLRSMIKKAPAPVCDWFHMKQYEVLETRFDGSSKSLASDSNSLDGLSLQLAVLDEFHAQKTSALLDVLQGSMGSRTSPLMLSITTAGTVPDGPCAHTMRVAKEVLDGLKEDARNYTLLYEFDDEDDWQDPSIWVKANPGLGVSITEEYLVGQMVDARNKGGNAVTNFLTKHGNRFQSGDEVWMDLKVWKEAESSWSPDGETPCYAGLDLATVYDITSLAVVWVRPDGTQYLKTWHWLPDSAIAKRLAKDENHVYGMVEELDNFFVTPGNATDYDAIRRFITGTYILDGVVQYDEDCLMEKYALEGVGYDPWNSSQLVINMLGDGVPMKKVRQGFGSLSFPMKHIQRGLLDGDFQHEEGPIMDWMMQNVVVDSDAAGNIKPNKAKAKDKVDGVAATVTATGVMLMEAEDEATEAKLPDDFTDFLISF